MATSPRIIASAPAPVSGQVSVLRLPPRTRAPTARMDKRPCFASSWIEDSSARAEDIVKEYIVHAVPVKISSPKGTSYGVYAVDPPEYRMNPVHIQALAETLSSVTRIMPTDLDVDSLATVRPYIKSKGKNLLYTRLADRGPYKREGKDLDRDADELAEVLCKYTAGYGVLETLLNDDNVQDIYVDSPSSQTPVHVVLRSDVAEGVRQKCRTNIFVERDDIQRFVSRVKFETGLAFSEAHPVLEADLKRLGARVTMVSPPLSDKGVSIAIRKHASQMWTMPMLIANGTLSPLLAGFLWACVVGRRTVLVAGSRGAGKTTLLSSMMLEFPRSQRIILIEDTPEVPAQRMQSLGFDVQTLRFCGGKLEATASAQETLRVSLRMGESAIVIGEVRGEEARVLYESMRAGSAGSSVLGTIHANSAKGVLDRAVEDLGVTQRAFSSTDLIVVIGLVRSPDGSRFSRRVIEVAEVRQKDESVALLRLFGTEPGFLCAKPTKEFSQDCRTVTGIADALNRGRAETMEIIKAKGHADQIAADLVAGDRSPLYDDEWSMRSNELLTKCLFCAEGPEQGLKEWRDWLETKQGT